MATYWENSCSFGLRYVSWYKYLIVNLVFSHLGFWSGNLFLVAPFPDHCLLVPFFEPQIQKVDTNYIRALDPEMKLAVTLRHLASGDKYPSLQYSFRVAKSTIVRLIPEVCQAIVDEYKDEVIQSPTTKDEWRVIADGFLSAHLHNALPV